MTDGSFTRPQPQLRFPFLNQDKRSTSCGVVQSGCGPTQLGSAVELGHGSTAHEV